MDFIDRMIRRAADAFQERARLQAVARRHARERAADANVLYEQIKDKVLFHFPLTRREQRPELSDAKFEQLQRAEWTHRTQLILSIVTTMGASDDDENPLENRSLHF
jgi:hypothetical protein